jgi:hypothetical protein
LAYLKTNTSGMLDVQETGVSRTKAVSVLLWGNQRAVLLSSGKRSQQKHLSLNVAVWDRKSSAPLPLGKIIQEKQVRTAIFWVIAQRVVVIYYRRFGTRVEKTCWILDPWRWDRNKRSVFRVQKTGARRNLLCVLRGEGWQGATQQDVTKL